MNITVPFCASLVQFPGNEVSGTMSLLLFFQQFFNRHKKVFQKPNTPTWLTRVQRISINTVSSVPTPFIAFRSCLASNSQGWSRRAKAVFSKFPLSSPLSTSGKSYQIMHAEMVLLHQSYIFIQMCNMGRNKAHKTPAS